MRYIVLAVLLSIGSPAGAVTTLILNIKGSTVFTRTECVSTTSCPTRPSIADIDINIAFDYTRRDPGGFLARLDSNFVLFGGQLLHVGELGGSAFNLRHHGLQGVDANVSFGPIDVMNAAPGLLADLSQSMGSMSFYYQVDSRYNIAQKVNVSITSFTLFGTNDVLGQPTVSSGHLNYVDVVPEPATWGLMLLGFGLVGAAARRRRTVAVA